MRTLRFLTLAIPLVLGGTRLAQAQHSLKLDNSTMAYDSVRLVHEFPAVLLYAGFGYYLTGRYEDAMTTWQQYLRRAGPEADRSVSVLIDSAFVRAYPDSYIYRGLAQATGGDAAGAVYSWERYLEIAPPGADLAGVRTLMEEAFVGEYPLALVYRGIALLASGDLDGAVRDWERYAQLTGDSTSSRQLIDRARQARDKKLAGKS